MWSLKRKVVLIANKGLRSLYMWHQVKSRLVTAEALVAPRYSNLLFKSRFIICLLNFRKYTVIAREQSTSVPELPSDHYVHEMSKTTQYANRDRHLEQIYNLCTKQGVFPIREVLYNFAKLHLRSPDQIAPLIAK